MSAEPPSPGRPTGPPSGPLSGPSEPDPTRPGATRPTPTPPSGGGDGGGPGKGGGGGGGGPSGPGDGHGHGPGGGAPWWRSAPRVAVATAVIVAAVALVLFFTRSDGDGGGEAKDEVFLEAAGSSGPGPFTASTAADSSAPAETPSVTSTQADNEVRTASGDTPGLYGGTRNRSSCDVEKQISFLEDKPDHNRAFASVQGIEPSEVPAYLRGLTPLQLRYDTRVTNHSFEDGQARPYQAVLQTGTAVLVDDRGVPRVRCACGNPLTPPQEQDSTPQETGDSWPGYRRENVVVVKEAKEPVEVFVVCDPEKDECFERREGDTGGKDKKTKPPADGQSPSPSTSTPSEPESGPSSKAPKPSAPPESSAPPAPPSQPGEEEQPPSGEASGAESAESGSGAPGTTTAASGPVRPVF